MDLYEIKQALTHKQVYELNLRVTFYARVSTDKYEQAHSLKNQVDYYRELIQNNPNWTYVEGYVDEGISGTSVSGRNEFKRMIEDAKNNKFDFIITKEISRFSRNTLDSIKYTQLLLSYGVGVLFQSDNINTLLPDAELRLTIMSSIAQDEVRKISERVRFGFKRAIDSGVVLGNNNIWGYRKEKGRLVIDENQAKVVRRIFELYALENVGIRRICDILANEGVFNSMGKPLSFSTVRGILSNPKYKGYYCGNKTHKIDYKMHKIKHLSPKEWLIYKDEEAVPPIVSEELWDKANSILNSRSTSVKTGATSYQNKYSLSGKVICKDHNTPYYRSLYKSPKVDREVWQCKHYAGYGKAGCQNPVIYTSEILDVIKEIMRYIDIDNIIKELISTYKNLNVDRNIYKSIQKTEREIENIKLMKDKILSLNIEGKIDDVELIERNNKYNNEIKKLLNSLNELKKSQNKGIDIKDDKLKEIYNQDKTRELILSEVLDKVIVGKGEKKGEVWASLYIKIINEVLILKIKRKRGDGEIIIENEIESDDINTA